jgi:hypothetical protein
VSPGTEAGSRAGALRVVDDVFLGQVSEGSDKAMRTLEVPRERPHLDLEVLFDPHVDAPEGEGDPLADPGQLVDAFLERYGRLREPLRDRGADIVLTGGDPIVQPGLGSGEEVDPAAAQAAVWEPALKKLSGHETIALGAHAGAEAGEEAAGVFCLREEGASGPEPLALVALVAWSGKVAAGAPARRTEALIRTMAKSVASHAPLHLICAVPDRDLSDDLIRECARLRVSLLLAGASRRTDIAAVSRARLQPGEAPSEVTVVRCPTFKAGVATAGMARVRVNAWRGDAEIAFLADAGPDRPRQPVQVLSQLLSASRVPSSERRLHGQVRLLLERASEEAEDEEQEKAVAGFREEVDARWEKDGYATLGNDAGRVPMIENRHTSYNLLLLLRERNGGYDVLLSNHSPLRPSPLSDWSTLLLPAFKDARALLEHLRDDVMRQVQERAEDFERAAHAHAFERAVEWILADDSEHGDELWADQLREVATRKIRKISPTTGAVTEFDYRLVTLLPLIDQATAKRADEEDQSEEGKRRLARYRIIEWLSGLDTVIGPDEDGEARGLSVGALEAGGCGLRWDPEVGLGGEAGTAQASRAEQVAPGAIWFPLKTVEGIPLWGGCPSIVSRNADVMAWMESVLARERLDDGRLPTELLLGKHVSGPDAYRVEEVFPFEGGEDDPGEPAASTLAAMRRVEFAKDSDLAGQLAYEAMEMKRVFLHRGKAEGSEREGIFVYEAAPGEDPGCKRPAGTVLGMLRPVQRYVLKAGLERAEQIHQQVRPALAEAGDPWGFARVRKGGAPKPVAVTPPIIEQLHPLDRERRENEGDEDFIICDGNHRVVQAVWNGGWALPAVAVIGDLPRPYYARPFGRLEWDATAENEQVVTPDVASKYLPRKVNREEDLPDDEARKKLAAIPDNMLFRRYYRDFESGFGYMGGQGGRFISG